MKFEIEFHDSQIGSVKIEKSRLMIDFDEAALNVIDPEKGFLEEEDLFVPASIEILNPIYEELPACEVLFNGDVRGIPGKIFRGVVPIDFQYTGHLELWLSSASGEFWVKGDGINVFVDRTNIPKRLIR